MKRYYFLDMLGPILYTVYIMKTLTLGLTNAISKVTSEIETYCSDTFSARGSRLTHTEALAMVAYLIETRLDIGITVDGVTLSAVLDEIRGR